MTSATTIPSATMTATTVTPASNDPVFLLRTEFFDIIKSVGAENQTLTLPQVLAYLKDYISERKLYNPMDPREIRVATDPLGGVFGTDIFTINEVIKLLSRQMYRMTPPVVHSAASPASQVPGTPAVPSVKRSAEDAGTPIAGPSNVNKRSRHLEGQVGNRSPMVLAIPPSPLLLSGEESNLSMQGYETAEAKNSSDDLWFLEENNSDDEEDDQFEVEYDVASMESDAPKASDTDSDSDIEDVVCEALFLCQDDSDVPFWADKSEDEGQGTSDSELEEGDKWTCKQCNSVNKPTTRYCLKCFDQRVGWLQGNDRHPPRRRTKLKRNLSDPGYMSSQSTVTASQEQDSEETIFSQESQKLTEKCMICLMRPKTGSIIHGKTAHQAWCYKCARKLQSSNDNRCPICRRKIDRVIRNFIA